MKVSAIIAAAGNGERMNGEDKVYSSLNGLPVLAHTLFAFESCGSIDNIVVVANKKKIENCRELIRMYNTELKKVSHVVVGGKRRQDSVYNGLNVIKKADYVVIHDGVRPFVGQKIIEESIKLARKYGAAVAAVKPINLIKVGKNICVETLGRNNLLEVHTPQTFRFEIIKRAHELARMNCYEADDDASLVEILDGFDGEIRVVGDSYLNIKITNPETFEIARACAAYLDNMK